MTKEIEIEITDEQFLFVAKEAHDRDITFNEMFNIIMREYLDEQCIHRE